jgi:chemotaxis protein methyltransferase CheR
MSTSSPSRVREFDFTQADFESLRTLVKEQSGITLGEAKRELVYGRVSRRLRALGLSAFADYRRMLAGPEGGAEMTEFINAVTTNLTSFFRESHHFDFLRNEYLPGRAADPRGSRRIRIWCSAASTGEEPYSIAMSVIEALPDWDRWDIRVLATDLDTNVLQTCVDGVYGEDRVRGLPKPRLDRFFDPVGDRSERRYKVKPELASMISFRQLNLMHPLPMKGPIDIVFCRNVIIYFDQPARRSVLRRIHEQMRPGAWLLLGHSESLLGVTADFELVHLRDDLVYRRPRGPGGRAGEDG